MQNWFVRKHACSCGKIESCVGLTGFGSHTSTCLKQKTTTDTHSPLCPNPLDAEKCHFRQKKKYASYYLKMCKNAISFFL